MQEVFDDEGDEGEEHEDEIFVETETYLLLDENSVMTVTILTEMVVAETVE